MADCHDLFQAFHDKIELSSSRKQFLKQARNALRKKVKDYFSEEREEKSPKFWNQGSYIMSTIINPLDDEYDIDDGVYLQNIDKDNKDWPSPETVHSWMCKATKGHTDKNPVDKRTCIRVIYSGKYHVDLPVYGEYKDEYYLAEKGDKGWHPSDPKGLTNWFKSQADKKGEQLKRIVRYLKAWVDHESNNGKLPSGLILTILVVDNYEIKDRDDVSFGRAIRNIYKSIVDSFIIHNPVNSQEDLAEGLTDSQKKRFRNLLLNLLDSAGEALKEENKKEACKIWRREFGDRFPNCDLIKEKKGPLYTSSPAILKDDARSA